jgi:hypothetical protein
LEEMKDDEVSTEEESMNQPDSSKEKLMSKQAHDSDDGNNSSIESEHNSVGMPTVIRFDDGSDDNDDDNFWM